MKTQNHQFIYDHEPFLEPGHDHKTHDIDHIWLQESTRLTISSVMDRKNWAAHIRVYGSDEMARELTKRIVELLNKHGFHPEEN